MLLSDQRAGLLVEVADLLGLAVLVRIEAALDHLELALVPPLALRDLRCLALEDREGQLAILRRVRRRARISALLEALAADHRHGRGRRRRLGLFDLVHQLFLAP